MSLAPRILIFTARLRYEGPAIASVYTMLRATGARCEWLQVDEQPYGREGPGAIGNQNILYLLTLARERLLSGDYTHLLCLEDDMVVPPDALDKLLAVGSPVAYSLYCWRRGPPHLWSVYRRLDEDGGASWSDDEPHTVAAMAQRGEVIDVAGVGLGCTLIDRATVEAIPWRLAGNGGRASCDWYFAVDCQRAGIRQRAHLGVQCGHLQTMPSARVIWPDPHGNSMTKSLHHYAYYERPVPAEVAV